jgi:hypothetical protein
MPRILETFTGPNKSRRDMEELDAIGATTCIDEEETMFTEEELDDTGIEITDVSATGVSGATCEELDDTGFSEIEELDKTGTSAEEEEISFIEEELDDKGLSEIEELDKTGTSSEEEDEDLTSASNSAKRSLTWAKEEVEKIIMSRKNNL